MKFLELLKCPLNQLHLLTLTLHFHHKDLEGKQRTEEDMKDEEIKGETPS